MQNTTINTVTQQTTPNLQEAAASLQTNRVTIERLNDAPISPMGDALTSRNSLETASIDSNRQIELKLAHIASNSSAAHKTVDALLNTLFEVFYRAENKNELQTMTKMLSAYQDPNNPNFSAVGQLSAGGFTRVMSEARTGVVTPNTQEPLTLREKATVYFGLTNSAYFKDTLESIHQNSEIQQAFSDLIDTQYLNTKQMQPPRRKTAGKELELAVYTNKNDDPQLKSYTENQRAYRTQAATAKTTYTTADKLLETDHFTQRELNYAKLNPKNSHQVQPKVTAFADIPNKDIIVQRGNGFATWDVVPDTDFSNQAATHQKPVVAGPSGTTDRFMTAARLLGNGLKTQLGLNTPQPNESSQQTSERADLEMKELSRWLATAYLVDDQHHSMIEVNLGAHNHGLEQQWGAELYTSPFSHTITGHEFSIDNSSVAEQLRTFSSAPSYTQGYKTDLT